MPALPARLGEPDLAPSGFAGSGVAQIRAQSRLPPAHKAGPTNEIMLLGACELLILKVAPHAAVDAANQLAAKDNKAVHFKPLINAVLRRLSRDGEAVLARLDAARLSTPDWLWTRWAAQYGEETARAIANAHLKQAPLDIVLKSGDAPVPDSQALFGPVRRLSGEGRIEDLPGYAEGAWWVQDAAASLPVLLLGDVAGKKVIDLCAAPGGKTMQLAARGAQVTAVEIESRTRWRGSAKIWRAPKLDAAQTVEGDARDLDIKRAAGPDRCALHCHRHHPPPSRPALDQGCGRCDGFGGRGL